MKLSCYLILFSICFLGELAVCQANPKPITSPTPSWVQQTKQSPKQVDLDDISEGYYYETVEYQVNLSEQKKYYKSSKVLFDNNGVENAGQLYVTFDPKYQKLALHELKIIREGKEIDMLNRSTFKVLAVETELSRFIYNGTYSAYCVLDDLRKNDKIVFAYSLQGFNPVFENNFFDSYYLQGYEPIGLLYINYVVPKTRNILLKCHNDAPDPQKSEHNDAIHYSWEIAGTEKGEYVQNRPYWATTLQWIECSEFTSWNEVGRWALRINPVSPIPGGSPLGIYVEKLWNTSGGDPYRFLEAATDFVQNEVRYMGIETGEHSHKANLPAKVFDQRYGDCKDKSVLLASILSSKGLSASVALVNTYQAYGLDNQLPSPLAFNHMVVRVNINGRQQYLDPTIANQGGDIKNRFFPYYGSVLDTHEPTRLTRTEKDTQSKTSIIETYVLHGERTATLTVKTTYQGGDADNIRQYFKNTARNQIQKSYLEYYNRIHSKVSKKEPLAFSDDVENNVFLVTEAYEIKEIGVMDDNVGKKYIPLYANHIGEKLPMLTEVRSDPIELAYPVHLEYDINIVNGNGNTIHVDRERIFYDRGSYLFSKNVRPIKDTLNIQFRLIHHDTYVPAEDVDQYVSDFEGRDNMLNCGYFVNDAGYLLGSDKNGTPGGVSWSLSLFIFLIFLFAIYLVGYNGKRPSRIITLYPDATHDKIGGWLIVLLIALVMSVLRILFGLVGPDSIFSISVWESSEEMVGVSSFAFKALIIYETIFNALLLVLLVYCIYLLIRRRDIFPQTFLFTLMLLVLFMALDLAFTWVVLKQHFQPLLMLSPIVNAIIFAAIWGTYVVRSERVKGTFVVPYGYTRYKHTPVVTDNEESV